VLAFGQRDHLLRRQQRIGDVLTMTIRVVAASALAGAAILLAGCGGATQTPHAAAEDETVVAQPVAPADLPELPASASE